MKTSIFVAIGCIAIASLLGANSSQDRDYRQIMIETDAAYQSLGRNISLENVFAIEDARELESLLQEVVDYWMKTTSGDAQNWAKGAANATRETIAAINRSRWQEAQEMTGTIESNCRACHNAYRDR